MHSVRSRWSTCRNARCALSASASHRMGSGGSRRPRGGGDHDLGPRIDEGGHLAVGGAGEADRVGDQGGQLAGVEGQAGVGGQAVEQVVGAALVPAGGGGRQRVLPHEGVGLLAAQAGVDGGEQDPGGGEERQGPPQLPLDRARGRRPPRASTVRTVSNRPSVARKAPGRAIRRAAESATSPSFQVAPASPATIVRWPLSTTASAATRSHDRALTLWGMADEPTWPSAKPSVASSCPAISRRVTARLAGPGDGLHEGGHHVEVERPGVHLARRWSAPARTRAGGPAARSSSSTRPGSPPSSSSCSADGAHRSLQAPQRVAGQQLLEPLERRAAAPRRPRRSACPGGGGRGHVVGAPGQDGAGVLGRPLGQAGQRGHHPVPHELEGAAGPGAARRSR